MRVGIDYRQALFDRSGHGRCVRELVRGLCEHNFAGNLGLFGYAPERRRYDDAALGLAGTNAELIRLRLPAAWTRTLMRKLGKGADDLVGGVQVFHHFDPWELPVRQAAEVVTILDTSFVYDAEGEGPGYEEPAVAALKTARAKALVARAARVLVPSEYVGAEVVLALGAHPARVATVELGCDHVARALPPEGFERSREPYVLTVARVEARKNHIRMLQAFELLVREGFPHRWLVVGPPGYGAEDFERALARSPVAERVAWRRAVPDDELPRLYARADAFLFASLHEGFGLPAVEAQACGTPVVASGVTALGEVLGDSAFLVEPSDAERIFEALRRILAEPELAASLVTRGRARSRRYTWRDAAKHTLLAYQAATQSPTEPSLRRSL